IAPEGTRSRTGTMQRAKPGIAYLALRTNAVLVPVAHWGVEKLSDWKRLRRPTCRVVIGRPFRLPTIEGKPGTEELQALADLIMVEHGRLLPPEYRGVYADDIAAAEAGQSKGLAVIPV
ncbi:MAG: 1-acyl-sn-glycerol-3-phosphate acyltransferase, partial [Chloroflexi bacterium]|nr:1-acyl-sn-glycerol-3-phosphate acyltransferase [Chloroflexota bacterium]